MKQALLIFISLFAFLSEVNSKSLFHIHKTQDEINKKDAEGKKQGKWIFFGKDRPAEGYPAEGKIEEGHYRDDRKEGWWIRYYNDGQTPKLKGEYKNHRPNGAFIKYYPNGKVQERGTFSRNQYKDSLLRYHENGVIEYAADYNNEGKESGKVKYFYANGQIEFEYDAVDGVATGKAVRYYENGDIKEVIFYSASGEVEKSEKREMVKPSINVTQNKATGETAPKIGTPRTKGLKFAPNGYNKCYNANDDIWQDGEFKNGALWDGKLYVYDKDGILLKVKVYKNGVYHSDGQL